MPLLKKKSIFRVWPFFLFPLPNFLFCWFSSCSIFWSIVHLSPCLQPAVCERCILMDLGSDSRLHSMLPLRSICLLSRQVSFLLPEFSFSYSVFPLLFSSAFRWCFLDVTAADSACVWWTVKVCEWSSCNIPWEPLWAAHHNQIPRSI